MLVSSIYSAQYIPARPALNSKEFPRARHLRNKIAGDTNDWEIYVKNRAG
jgi:hypothetical protein